MKRPGAKRRSSSGPKPQDSFVKAFRIFASWLKFDYAYDKRLYDRLLEGEAKPVREHFYAGLDYQDKLARFLENHDEPRAASAFEMNMHKAAAVITFLSPGLRFFHQGQLEGRKKRISPHLVRGPQEPADPDLEKFYTQLLLVLKNTLFRDGQWHLLQCLQAWEGNASSDSFIAFVWEGANDEWALVIVNYAPHAGQCYIQVPIAELAGESVQFRDLMSAALYDRDGNEVLSGGIYLDMNAWAYHIFEIGVPAKKIAGEITEPTIAKKIPSPVPGD